MPRQTLKKLVLTFIFLFQIISLAKVADDPIFRVKDSNSGSSQALQKIITENESVKARFNKIYANLQETGLLIDLELNTFALTSDPDNCYMGAKVIYQFNEGLVPEAYQTINLTYEGKTYLGEKVRNCKVTAFKVKAFLRKVNSQLVQKIDRVLDQFEVH